MLFTDSGNIQMTNLHLGGNLIGEFDIEKFSKLKSGGYVPILTLGERVDSATQFITGRDKKNNTSFIFFRNLPKEFKAGDNVPEEKCSKSEDTYFIMEINKADSAHTLMKILEHVFSQFSEEEQIAAKKKWDDIEKKFY